MKVTTFMKNFKDLRASPEMDCQCCTYLNDKNRECLSLNSWRKPNLTRTESEAAFC